jgi:hypothetical protein
VTPNATNIIAYENEKAVLPCVPTDGTINITLYKGEYSWNMRRVSAAVCAELYGLRQLGCVCVYMCACVWFTDDNNHL